MWGQSLLLFRVAINCTDIAIFVCSLNILVDAWPKVCLSCSKLHLINGIMAQVQDFQSFCCGIISLCDLKRRPSSWLILSLWFQDPSRLSRQSLPVFGQPWCTTLLSRVRVTSLCIAVQSSPSLMGLTSVVEVIWCTHIMLIAHVF